MTQEEKELLFKDLCARLPYGTMVKCNTDNRHEFDEELSDIHIMNFYQFEVKPYLRPMSSMTEDEKREYEELCNEDIRQLTDVQILHPGLKYKTSCHRSIDWLNANHFDYRGFIEKGLALEAPEGMYK